jgi:hypothetical protein
MLLAELIVGQNFQKVFNLNKGSIPARTDVPLDDFDSCALTSAADMADLRAGSLLPSLRPWHGAARRPGRGHHRCRDGAFQLGHELAGSRGACWPTPWRIRM